MRDYKVSIIMPTYNAENYLRRSITSVLNQTYINWELYIVDDGSRDRSIELCKQFEKGDHRIHLLENEHGGTAKARNAALDRIDGDYVAFLDSDDAYHPDFIKYMIRAIQKSKASIAMCGIMRGTDETEFLLEKKECRFEVISSEEAFEKMYGGKWLDFIVPWTKIYDRKLFDNVRFPNGMFFEDAATIYKPIYYSQSLAITDEELYFYNITPGSSSATKKSIELLDREKALRSHWEFFLKQNRKDLAYRSLPFYLTELISIYHRIEGSDCPGDCAKIKKKFKDTYRKYKRNIQFSENQKDQMLAFLYPRIFDIRNMIYKDGIVKTTWGFVKRKCERYGGK